MKQQLEGFLCQSLVERVDYRATGYRYLPDKIGRCYITVDKKEILNFNNENTLIRWFQTEQEIKNDPHLQISISAEDIDGVKKETCGKVPEERLLVIAKKRKISDYSKDMMEAQAVLCKSDFYGAANAFLSTPIEESLESKDILINIFALVDRRVGKKRLQDMREMMKLKHPIVQYFYELRCGN
ncbi:SF0329 family protein [Anaeromicropila herbilytica]|uniref:Uncharacterized protein n=1 Tax=Anaeromicropila herbilytica TaxID=2785025 RepID=A0A7R7IBW2_9FIRM|nr:hypothetical protein [Anaeromicropila herbilytica]BCN29226.1 hypothetical protein bsdtb5_05210 [Anaeromicropila herbilytica]